MSVILSLHYAESQRQILKFYLSSGKYNYCGIHHQFKIKLFVTTTYSISIQILAVFFPLNLIYLFMCGILITAFLIV